jgi:hypothetical protein
MQQAGAEATTANIDSSCHLTETLHAQGNLIVLQVSSRK